jgi:D-alanine-D-alanine ligase
VNPVILSNAQIELLQKGVGAKPLNGCGWQPVLRKTMRIAILHDKITEKARKDDLDVLAQIAPVSQALLDLGHKPKTVPFSLDLRTAMRALRNKRPDLVFNLVESVEGQGRLIHLAPAILDSMNLPYTGARTEAMFLTSNKITCKNLLGGAGISTPPWFSARGHVNRSGALEGRWILKSVWEHASIGLDEDAVISPGSAEALQRELKRRAEQLGGEVFAETYIEGREFNLALLAGDDGPQVLPPAEIVFEGYGAEKLKVVGYRAKWEENTFEYDHTIHCFDFPENDSALLERMKVIASQCWRLFGLRGYARVDFRVDQSGEPWVLEINANPCLSPDAGYAAAIEKAGLHFRQAIERIMEDAMRNAEC